MKVDRARVEPATPQSPIRCPTTTPPRQALDKPPTRDVPVVICKF